MNSIEELKILAAFLEGMAAASERTDVALKLRNSSNWLQKIISSGRICGQGYFGCGGGAECESEHK